MKAEPTRRLPDFKTRFGFAVQMARLKALRKDEYDCEPPLIADSRQFQIDNKNNFSPFPRFRKHCFGGITISPAICIYLSVFFDLVVVVKQEIVFVLVFECACAG